MTGGHASKEQYLQVPRQLEEEAAASRDAHGIQGQLLQAEEGAVGG